MDKTPPKTSSGFWHNLGFTYGSTENFDLESANENYDNDVAIQGGKYQRNKDTGVGENRESNQSPPQNDLDGPDEVLTVRQSADGSGNKVDVNVNVGSQYVSEDIIPNSILPV